MTTNTVINGNIDGRTTVCERSAFQAPQKASLHKN